MLSDRKQCTGCGACAAACAHGAIFMQADELGFQYPVINQKNCIKCGVCQKKCPVMNINCKQDVFQETTNIYAAWSKDKKLQKQSSSGGIFGELSKDILDDGGVVFGAAYNESLELHHIAVFSVEDLPKLLGSKYVQSNIGNCYTQVKKYLAENKKVLFSGTPCQISGLYAFLNNNNSENLFTVEILCHGVPSPEIFKQYLKYISKNYLHGEVVKEYSFRNKKCGWKNFCTQARSDRHTYRRFFYEDNFMHGFLKNYYLRESCYQCQYAIPQRYADITLGDFWGYEQFDYPKFNYDRGASIVICSTMKGNELFSGINDRIYCRTVPFDDCAAYNTVLTHPCKMPEDRNKILNIFHEKGLVEMLGQFQIPSRPISVKILSLFGKLPYHFINEVLPKVKRRLTGKRRS